MKKIILVTSICFMCLVLVLNSCKKTTSNKTTSTFVCNDNHLSISVGNCCLYAPNIFSPNSDGRNDLYTVIADSMSSYTLTIQDTNQNVLYTSNSVSNGWDGKVSGVLQAETFYSARIQASFINCTTTIDTTTCFYLGAYNSNGCIPKYSTTPLYFYDQVDPITPCSLPPYPTADSLCP